VIVGEPKWVFSLEGDDSIIGVDPGEYYTSVFCNLVVNSGMCTGLIGGLSTRR